MTADVNSTVKKGYTLIKLEKYTCPECGGVLSPLDKGEIKKLRLRIAIPEIFKCPDCENIFAVNKTITDEGRWEWREMMEYVGDLVIPEKEFISEMMNGVGKGSKSSSVVRQQPEFFSLGRVYKCGGQGVGCELYYLASSGLSVKAICGAKKCKYDPYTKDYKRKNWVGGNCGNKNPSCDNIIDYWKAKIIKSPDLETKVDAVRRFGSLRVPEVRSFLLEIFKNKKEKLTIRQVVAERLSHFRDKKDSDEIVAESFAGVILTEGEKGGDLIETIFSLIRTREIRATEFLVHAILLLYNDPIVGKTAEITLRVMQKKALKQA